MSKLLENKQLVHIASEVVVLLGLTFYFNQQNKKLMGHIEDLVQRIEDQEDLLQKHEEVIKKLVEYVNQQQSVMKSTPQQVVPTQVQQQVQTQVPTQVPPQQYKSVLKNVEKSSPKKVSKPVKSSHQVYLEPKVSVSNEEEKDDSSHISDLDAEIAEELEELDEEEEDEIEEFENDSGLKKHR
jgi:hypothetical protein